MHSDVSIAGDPLALPHLLPPVPQHPGTLAGFAALARSIAADREHWAPAVRYDAATGWHARLRSGPGYQVWLLGWLPGRSSGVHDHGRSCGVLTVLRGTLRERARTGRGERSRVLAAGAQRAFAAGCVHEIVNDSLEPAVSLHVCFPGRTRTRPYAGRPAAHPQAAPAPAAAPAAPVQAPAPAPAGR